jgi:hypothetical protein
MQRLFAMMLSVTFVFATLFAVISAIGITPVLARGTAHSIARGAGAGIAHVAGAGIGRRGRVGIGRGVAARQVTPRLNAIPAQLPEPAQAPIINGPLSSNGLPSMGNGLR